MPRGRLPAMTKSEAITPMIPIAFPASYRHFARWCPVFTPFDAVLCRATGSKGRPQWTQEGAESDTCLPQSGQIRRPMISLSLSASAVHLALVPPGGPPARSDALHDMHRRRADGKSRSTAAPAPRWGTNLTPS